jgi:hypothetical protein
MFGCNHRWGWPRKKQDLPFAYQCCSQCGAERDYRGPLTTGNPEKSFVVFGGI